MGSAKGQEPSTLAPPSPAQAGGSTHQAAGGSAAGGSPGWQRPGPHTGWSDGGSLEYPEHASTPGYVRCDGPDLQCGVVHRHPQPRVDFRGLPRHARGSRGMVAADSSRCSETGLNALQAGGSAVDAAVAVALCQGVVNPVASGLGGGAFIMVRLANGSAAFIDARETAPGAANATMYAGLPESASLDGGLAVAVPCELRGLEAAWRRYGRLSWAQLVRPAARLARSGFAAHPYLVYVLSGPGNFRKVKESPGLREAFLIPNGSDWRVPVVGELCCRRPKLADTLDNIAIHGAGWLYSPGVTATLAAEVQAAGGIITQLDLQAAAAAVVDPLTVRLADTTLLIPPPPSSAAVVAFALNFLQGYAARNASAAAPPSAAANGSAAPAAAAAGGMAFGGDASGDRGLGLHRLLESMKHGFAVRTQLGDPTRPYTDNATAARIGEALADLLDPAFAEALRTATLDGGVLPPHAYGGRWNPLLGGAEEHGTSHFCVVDEERNAVSVTSTVNTAFGSGVVSPSTGILFNNEMDDFAQPNRTSFVTPHPATANFIAPGKRPLSAMSPTIVLGPDGSSLRAVAGGSGGPLIVSATLTTLARLLLQGMGLEEAVAAPRVHDQLLPRASAFFENYTWGGLQVQLDGQAQDALAARGQVLVGTGYALGIVQAILVGPPGGASAGAGGASAGAGGASAGAGGAAGGPGAAAGNGSAAGAGALLQGMSDPRKDGAAMGY